MLPNRIFFTGVPGSRWSGVAQLLESTPGFNVTDRTPERTFVFKSESEYSKHYGAYFGKGMEFSTSLDAANIDAAHTDHTGCRLIKSHEWAYNLDQIKQQYPNDWIVLVYRPDLLSYAWWYGAGGFNITYPKYQEFKDSTNMMAEIARMNQCILEFAYKHDATWNHITPRWVNENFGVDPSVGHKFNDVLITIIK